MKKEATPKTVEQRVIDYLGGLKIVPIESQIKNELLFAIHGKNNHNRLVKTDKEASFFETLKDDAESSFEDFVSAAKKEKTYRKPQSA